MKKYLAIISFTMVLVLGLTACAGSDLESYQAAMEKTNSMVKGSDSMDISIKTKYNSNGLEEDLQGLLESYGETRFSTKGSFDKEQNKFIKMGYLSSGDLGYDFNVYGIEDIYYIEHFFFNLKDHRYIQLSLDDFEIQESEMPLEFLTKISDKWNEIINEENVMKGENVLVSTDDGEVKSREFTIRLNDSQLKEFLIYVIEQFEENEEYLNIMEEMTYMNAEEVLTEDEKGEIYEEVFDSLKEFIKTSDGLSLFYKAYIDIDGYVVQEDIDFSMDTQGSDKANLLNLEFTMTSKYWNIEKDQDLDYEIPRVEDSIRLDEIDIKELIPYREVE